MKKLLALSLLTVVGLSAYAQEKQPVKNENQCVEKQVVVPAHPHDTAKYHEEIEQTKVVTILDCGETEPVSDEIKEKAKNYKVKVPGNIQDTEKP